VKPNPEPRAALITTISENPSRDRNRGITKTSKRGSTLQNSSTKGSKVYESVIIIGDSGRWSSAAKRSAESRSITNATEALADMPVTKPKRILRQELVRDRDESMKS
jgi:hypothetical protein